MKSSSDDRRVSMMQRYDAVRQFSQQLCAPLQIEDYVIQSMPDASPTRWHLAHTTWFFETFVLKPHRNGFRSPDPQFEYLFNSYYNSVGEAFPRLQRGQLSRPTVKEVMEYRRKIDDQMIGLLAEAPQDRLAALLDVVELGLHHEQQHQELMLTDIKHVFSCNPLFPVYSPRKDDSLRAPAAEELSNSQWMEGKHGVLLLGDASEGFVFDNERPRHQVIVSPHHIASRLVTCGEYRRFMDDNGYRQPQWWLSLGWQVVSEHGWTAPLYWYKIDGQWHQFTLQGLRAIDDDEPVCHVSYFEADAYARWCGCRLPSEAEWESLAITVPIGGNLAERKRFHPIRGERSDSVQQLYGDVWEWTASPYTPYPGYRPPAGALGEYNGKFMCNQFVLRGGSCATSASHIRPTYRNFFPPETRWQFTGIRLAQDAS